MSATLISKLLESFDELDRCIALTREVLEQKGSVPPEVVERVGKYSEVVARQRQLAAQLKERIAAQDWEEVARHVRIINGLSVMIRDDAQAILSGHGVCSSHGEKDSLMYS